MPRARSIKPSIFKNEHLGTADPLLTILFESLWTLADREGRLEDRPLRIKAETFPYRDGVDVDSMLTWLHDHKFIERYEVDGDKCIQVLKFLEHQNPHKNEAPSTIKERVTRSITRAARSNGGSTSIQGSKPAQPRHKAIGLTPSSLTPYSLTPSSLESAFEVFWSDWPKKVAKEAAVKAWKKLEPDVDLVAIILADVAKRKASQEWHNENGKYIPHPATYLNGKRWEDQGTILTEPEEDDAERKFQRWQTEQTLAKTRANEPKSEESW